MFNSTTRIYTLDIVITWDEPSNPNGVITFYEVNVTQTDDSGIVVYSNSSLPVPNVIESVMVLPFTNYTVTVAASTSAGQGDEVAISIESPEAGKYAVSSMVAMWHDSKITTLLCCSFLTFSCMGILTEFRATRYIYVFIL